MIHSDAVGRGVYGLTAAKVRIAGRERHRGNLALSNVPYLYRARQASDWGIAWLCEAAKGHLGSGGCVSYPLMGEPEIAAMSEVRSRCSRKQNRG